MEGAETVSHWSARRMSPKVLLYVGFVFIAFMVISYWGFNSLSAVKALAFAAIGSIVTFLPLVFAQIEYRLTGQLLESRPLSKKVEKPYKFLFQLNQVSHIIPIDGGFKYYLILKEENWILRFWKKHISDRYSGEVKVEKKDSERIISIFEKNGILIKGKR